MTLIDTHCHLDAPELLSTDQVVQRALEAQVEKIIIPSVFKANFQTVIQLAERYEAVYFALGIHPLYISNAYLTDLIHLNQLVQYCQDHPKFVGIGEIGLDLFIENPNWDKQVHFYKEQLKLAKQYHLPVIVHSRKTHDVILKYLKDYQINRGIIHAFNGSLQQAQAIQKQGLKLGFGGAMTWTRAKKIRQLAQTLPIEQIVLETDAPDIPPEWLTDNSPNEPKELYRIAQTLATLRGVSLEEIAIQTTQNAHDVFFSGARVRD